MRFDGSLTDLSLVSTGMGIRADSPGVVALAEAFRTQGAFLPTLRQLKLDSRLERESKFRQRNALAEGVQHGVRKGTRPRLVYLDASADWKENYWTKWHLGEEDIQCVREKGNRMI